MLSVNTDDSCKDPEPDGDLKILKGSAEIQTWSQSYDRELQRQRCKSYNATSSLVRFENKNIFFYFEKRSSILL
jgi:hypothetical protein